MSPEAAPHSPRSDPGMVHSRYPSTSEYPLGADERFAYKNRRKDQRKKPAFPKSGGPSILVYVKDDPRKNSNKNMYQHYGLLPHLPFLPPVPSNQGFDPLRMPYINPSLMMFPPLPPLPPHLLQNPFPQQRQRTYSSPTLPNYSSTQANYTTQQMPNFTPTPTFTFASNYTTTPNSVPQTTSASVYPPGTNPAFEMPAPTGTKTDTNQFNPFPTTLPCTMAYHLPTPYYTLPTGPVTGQRTPQQNPLPQNPLPQNPLPGQLDQNPYVAQSRMTNSTSGSKTKFSPQYSPAQIPVKTGQVDSSTQSSPLSAEQFQDSSPVTNQPPSYPNAYSAKCNCEQCQSSPTGSDSSISTNDSGYIEGGKSFSAFKDDSGERPLLFCDQNNPTFSLDPASLSHYMGMARRENIDRNEHLFLDEKRQIRKKIPCRNLSQTGVCQFGETCWFNHQLYNN
ncbi:DNA-directed RNA polymerase II subunit RPB1-like [Bolinopsis microptera]|uniref:DNA-directed RNA polymerase II subunit RPB1-like n=1 Tax=Bolinopsis microptera TaxID=2820187 RepID=UPI00307AF643